MISKKFSRRQFPVENLKPRQYFILVSRTSLSCSRKNPKCVHLNSRDSPLKEDDAQLCIIS